MNIQKSNKARQFSLIIGAVGLVISNKTQAACDYYKSTPCPQTYTCNNSPWVLLNKSQTYYQRWSCGSGYSDPVYQKWYQCVYVSNFNQPILTQAKCGPIEMRPQFSDRLQLTPVTCPSKPCVGPGQLVEPPWYSGLTGF